jgi:hypothetical protein
MSFGATNWTRARRRFRLGTFLALYATSTEAADENAMPIIEIERSEIRLKAGTETPRDNRRALLGIEAAARDMEAGIREQNSLSASPRERNMRDVAIMTGYFAIVLTAMVGWVWMLFSSVGWLIGV